jgi:TDG/mug DNA glycosylase family protein
VKRSTARDSTFHVKRSTTGDPTFHVEHTPPAKDAKRPRPSEAELNAALAKKVPDLIAPDLRILFCGINPGRYSAAAGKHFAGPGNRMWPSLFAAGLTPRLFTPFDSEELLALGYGITNIVARATATAEELSKHEIVAGLRVLEKKARKYRPRIVAFLGLGAYRTAFARPRAVDGLQPETLGPSKLWLLPNPSGLNAHHQGEPMIRMFRELRLYAERG